MRKILSLMQKTLRSVLRMECFSRIKAVAHFERGELMFSAHVQNTSNVFRVMRKPVKETSPHLTLRAQDQWLDA